MYSRSRNALTIGIARLASFGCHQINLGANPVFDAEKKRHDGYFHPEIGDFDFRSCLAFERCAVEHAIDFKHGRLSCAVDRQVAGQLALDRSVGRWRLCVHTKFFWHKDASRKFRRFEKTPLDVIVAIRVIALQRG